MRIKELLITEKKEGKGYKVLPQSTPMKLFLPFNPKDIMVTDDMERYRNCCEFRKFVIDGERFNREAVENNKQMVESAPFVEAVNLREHGNKLCCVCGNRVKKCINVLHGTYCAATTIRYFNDDIKNANKLVRRKNFVDTYSCVVEEEKYQKTRELGDVKLFYPPACVEHNSMKYTMDWLEWKRNGMWVKRGANIPATYFQH